MFLNEEFQRVFTQTLFAMLRCKSLSVAEYLYDLLRNTPLDRERVCSWNFFLDNVLFYIQNKRVPTWIDKWVVPLPNERDIDVIGDRDAAILFFRAQYNSIDCLQTLLQTYLGQFRVEECGAGEKYKKACKTYEVAAYKDVCNEKLTAEERVMIDRGYLGMVRNE